MLHLLLYTRSQHKRICVDTSEADIMQNILRMIWRETDVDRFLGGEGGVRLRNSLKTQQTFQSIVDKYGATCHQLKRLVAALTDLSSDEGFYIINEDKSGENAIVCRKVAIACLNAEQKGQNWHVEHNRKFEFYTFLRLKFRYYSYGFDGIPLKIGEPDKTKRRCRFCGKTGAENYHDVAHAIQDSLGNKLLICNEECDECNHTLNSIEDNFLHVMDFRRAIYQISRKKSAKCATVIGYNCVVKPNDIGEAEVYLMDEDLPPKDQRGEPFLYKLCNKAILTNEGVYKALVKMVLDLIPAEEVCHFQQTINWLKPDVNWHTDGLPSIYFAETGEWHEQPFLDVFLRREDDGITPYCSAMLWIYDCAYQFIVPLADVDRGRFKYDTDLEQHWEVMHYLFPFNWGKQDAVDWHEAYAWMWLKVDIKNPKIHILSKDDPIFEGSRKEKQEILEEYFPKFTPQGISYPVVSVSFTNLYHGRKLTVDDLRDVTEELTGPTFFLDEIKQEVSFTLELSAKDTTNTIPYFEFSVNAVYHFKEFSQYIHITKDANGFPIDFVVDFHLSNYLYKFSLLIGEQKMATLRRGTDFEDCSLLRLMDDDSMELYLRNSLYHLVVENVGRLTKSDKQMHSIAYNKSIVRPLLPIAMMPVWTM